MLPDRSLSSILGIFFNKKRNLTQQKSKICILYTGGTFGMIPRMPEVTSSPLVPADRETLMAALQGAGRGKGIEWDLLSLTEDDGSEVGPLDSSSVGPQHWLTIA